MKCDEIIRMAREAEFCDASELDLNVEWTCSFFELQHFVALVAAAEREACAKVIEEFGRDGSEYAPVLPYLTRQIRARGQQ